MLSIARGVRLEFVVRELKGKRKRVVNGWDAKKKKITEKTVEEAAGYMIYFPNGTSYRLTKDELIQRGFDREPSIINLDQVNDTKSPAGKFKFAMSPDTKLAAYRQMEEQVVKACKRRGGYAESGEDNDAEAA